MFIMQRYYYISSYITLLLDDFAQTDWRRHKQLKFVLKWFVSYITTKTYSYKSTQIISQTLRGATSLC